MANALINRKDTVEVYLSEAEVTAEDKLVNVGSVGDVGYTVEEVETEWFDTDKMKAPGSVTYDSIEIEQNVLVAEDEQLDTWAKAGTILNFLLVIQDKKGGEFKRARKGTGFISTNHFVSLGKNETIKTKYTISVNSLEITSDVLTAN